ncbi:Centrosomal protein [Actinidia chinensis var. chinensis]|uniref:Centrosomal protein n=1 Tax=Actinidia chinensis var. chinensis TaxID=1590841 RepID=A0A2R6RUB3_ACTCC|nr:Centrosomal protein [Actinidia chinensis var. chinensis]
MPFSSKKTPTMFVDQFANSEWPTTAAMFDASHATTTAIGAPSMRPPLLDDHNLKFLDKVKEAKELFLAAKHKEKQVLKQKMLDEVAKAIIAKNGDFLSISEHEAVVSKMKTEAAQAHAEMLESKDNMLYKQRSDAVRTEPILSDISSILLQDVGTKDAVGSGEKWLTFDVAPEKAAMKLIRVKRVLMTGSMAF